MLIFASWLLYFVIGYYFCCVYVAVYLLCIGCIYLFIGWVGLNLGIMEGMLSAWMSFCMDRSILLYAYVDGLIDGRDRHPVTGEKLDWE
jgi:hypothetical protein